MRSDLVSSIGYLGISCILVFSNAIELYVVWPRMGSNEYRFNCFINNHEQKTCIIIMVVIQLYILIIIGTLAKPVQVSIINRISYIV